MFMLSDLVDYLDACLIVTTNFPQLISISDSVDVKSFLCGATSDSSSSPFGSCWPCDNRRKHIKSSWDSPEHKACKLEKDEFCIIECFCGL
ncbi:unnamed protein product [Moneuplotes crassus]|uniref:Uncharacterized protein n=1 Tax=Euplotes crassus TaxID=5936 RepID=A0AAD1U6F9_EUPCR|nr:unnamed protein product [Moneuplotes crassus]